MATRQRSLFRDAKPPSRLEKRFELLWQQLSGPELEKEFRFHSVRKWRGAVLVEDRFDVRHRAV
jgi:hypothetical protein